MFFSNCKSMVANNPRGGAIFDTRGMVGRNYKEDNYTLLHTKYESSGPCDLEKIFYVFPTTPPVWTPGTWLPGFIKRNTTHCYTQNMKALGLVVLEMKTLFLMFFPL